MALASSSLRLLQIANAALQWMSAVIVMGIVSYFINVGPKGEHIIYEEVIATISVAFFLPAFALSFVPKLGRCVLAIDTIFSYLWLTSFIFEAQDYNWKSCSAHAPPGRSCSIKKAGEAFTFLTFFCTFVAILLDAAVLYKSRDTVATPVEEKRTSAETGTTA